MRDLNTLSRPDKSIPPGFQGVAMKNMIGTGSALSA
jgi:hypothetical protein